MPDRPEIVRMRARGRPRRQSAAAESAFLPA